MIRRLLLALVLSISTALPAAATQTPFAPYLGELDGELERWYSAMFERYKSAFIKPDGRVFDPQNGGITHSESQGYGMMLALLGDDRATFDKVWLFAKNTMQKSDKLFGWKYVPGQGVTDWNNATDGELLIATALALAGERWEEPSYTAEAVAIAEATGQHMIRRYGGYTLLMPGNWAEPSGRKRSMTVNLSYFIPLTLRVMQVLAPRHDWEGVYADSIRLLNEMIHPPSDWTDVNKHGEPNPAQGWEPKFSYDAVRIPLYLLQGGVQHPKVFQIVLAIWGQAGDSYTFPFDVYSGRPVDRFWGNSYELTHDIILCQEMGRPVPWESVNLKMDSYFNASLHLMLLASLHATYPHCFPDRG